jgi:hypothetical protein
MTTERKKTALQICGVLAALLGSQSVVASWPLPGNALILLPSEGAIAGLGDGLRRGFSLAQEQNHLCGAAKTQWSVGWLKPGDDPAIQLQNRRLPPLVLAPPATPLVETGLLAESKQRQTLLPLQRGASLHQLASRRGSDFLWPVTPARSLEIDALVKAMVQSNLRSFLLISDGSSDQQLLADRFLETMRLKGGVLLGTDLQARRIDPNNSEDLKLLISDTEWFRPAALVVMSPRNSPLTLAVLAQTWPEDLRLVWNFAPRTPNKQVQLGVEEISRGPGWKSFDSAFKKRYGYTPGTVEAAGYDSGQLVALSVIPTKNSATNGMAGFNPARKPESICKNVKLRKGGSAARPIGAISNMDMRAATPPTAQLNVIQLEVNGAQLRKSFNLGAK